MIELIIPPLLSLTGVALTGYMWAFNRRFKADMDSIEDQRERSVRGTERRIAERKAALEAEHQRLRQIDGSLLAELSVKADPDIPLAKQYDVRRRMGRAKRQIATVYGLPKEMIGPPATGIPVHRLGRPASSVSSRPPVKPSFPMELPASLRPDPNPFSPDQPTSWRDRFTEWWVSHADPK